MNLGSAPRRTVTAPVSIPEPAPVITTPVSEEDSTTKNERLRKIGRAQLIETGPRGVLGSPNLGRRQVTGTR